MSVAGRATPLGYALAEFASLDRVLIASDYDGCVAPIVSRPEDAAADPASTAALAAAAELPGTWSALVSGRAREDLATLSGLGDPVTLVGSHGAEFESGFDEPLTAEQKALLAAVVDEFESITARFPDTSVETKPVSTTLHVRNASDDDARAALTLAVEGPASWSGVHVTHGKSVIELAVIETSKGHALDRLRDRVHAQAVLYLGDDITDEKAFAHLNLPGDVGIKVGDGATAAKFRIAGTAEVAEVLTAAVELRAATTRS
ncbi:trehalose-phosphatase [Gordonia sp. (in: high G+C Gram-positive bacteria)]|uniref:trehalose-phosphatase n=1 Tax=Gordonia sp. (in: high G+C Gram-positive bacteria) TaxID=84139 RepID=UPI003F9BDA72